MSNHQQPAANSQHRMVVARLMPRPIPSVRRGIEPRRRSARAIRVPWTRYSRFCRRSASTRGIRTAARRYQDCRTADIGAIQKAVTDGKPVVLLNDWRFKKHQSNLGHIRTDDGEIGFKAADYFMSIGRFRSFGFVPERRLAALSAMLRKSKSPICRVIKDCGFGSVNHAKAVFKKRFGMTMRDYRSTPHNLNDKVM